MKHRRIKKTARLLFRLSAFVISSFLLVAVTLILARAVAVRSGPDLEWWHTEKIQAEFSAGVSEDVFTLDQYLSMEAEVFDELQALVEKTPPVEGHHLNRYKTGNRSYPEKDGQNLNRSRQWSPEVTRGGILLLHGMTDSPYSLRHLADMFAARGFYVLNLRMPGHGTIPSELDRLQWQDWQAAVKLGASHVSSQIGQEQPFYVLGYSNGASLALKYSLDSLGDSNARTPDRVFLLSPMIGVDPVARFSRLFYWLGRIEFFEQSRWLDIYPEYDPHKYNSFPMNAGLQSYKLTTAIKEQVLQMAGDRNVEGMPPLLAFQSLVDKTVATSALVDNLYEKLPANGSELILFDINRTGELGQYILPKHGQLLDRVMNSGSGKYAITVVTNRSGNDPMIVELRKAPSWPDFIRRDLEYRWPRGVYSLSHVALPFPLWDDVYGLEAPVLDSGYPHLGRVHVLGESGALILPTDLLQRLRSNPFYGYIEERLEAVISEDL